MLAVFARFAAFGKGRASPSPSEPRVDGKAFAKLCKDCGLLDKKLTTTDVDLIFAKLKKGGKDIDFDTFRDQAVPELARRKGMDAAEVARAAAGRGRVS
eukprot:gene52662-17751_t